MNQYFQLCWNRRRVSVRVGREEERGGVLVHDDFRMIVVADQQAVQRYPAGDPRRF